MSIEKTLAERGERYGAFRHHAVIAQGIKDVMWATEGWVRLAADQRQALEVIADKAARILNGDPNYVDNWHDIVGYAQLVENRLVEDQTPVPDTVQVNGHHTMGVTAYEEMLRMINCMPKEYREDSDGKPLYGDLKRFGPLYTLGIMRGDEL